MEKMASQNIYAVGRRVVDMFHSKGFCDVTVQFETGPARGDGLIGITLHAKICAVKGGVPQEFSAVVKCAPSLESFRKATPIAHLFRRETLYYTKIVPIYDNLQDQFELCVPQEMRCFLPKCFATCSDMKEEMIILEDLTEKGYSAPRLKTLDYEHAALILRIVAKLHALSFIYEDRYPKRFREIAEQCVDGLTDPDEEFEEKYIRQHGEYVMKQFLNAIIDDSLKTRCRKVLGSNAYEKFKEIHKTGKVMAILHGDNWHYNFMFKYKGGKATEAVPIDFQWSRYGSIGYDFMYLFNFSAQGELRRHRFYELRDEYYSAFKGFLALCGYDADRFCTYEQFKEELKSQATTTLVSFMIGNPLVTNPHLKLPEILSSSVYSTVSEEYVLRVNDLVADWANFGFL